MEALSSLVRDRVRQQRIDPSQDPDRVTAIAHEVVAERERESLTGRVAPLSAPDDVVSEIVSELVGLGPLQAFLDDPDIEEIWINAPDRVFVARSGQAELTSVILTHNEIRDLVERMLAFTGRRLDFSSPFADATLPGGHRLHVVLDGIVRGFTAVNIRKFVARASSLAELVELGSLTDEAAELLSDAVKAGSSFLVSGGTQAGKTTIVNCLAHSIEGNKRLISAEEVFELRCDHPDWVAMQTRQAGLEGTGEVTLRDLVRESLRMRPDWLVVGEVRGAEALDLLLALNSGLPAMATLHANSAQQALSKLATLPLLAGENIGTSFVVPTIAASLNYVVHTAMDNDRRRAVRQIIRLTGRVEDGRIETETVFVHDEGQLRRTNGFVGALESLAGGPTWAR